MNSACNINKQKLATRFDDHRRSFSLHVSVPPGILAGLDKRLKKNYRASATNGNWSVSKVERAVCFEV